MIEITETIYSNSERSERVLVTLCCAWMFLIYNELEHLELKLEEIIGIYKHTGKVRKYCLFSAHI